MSDTMTIATTGRPAVQPSTVLRSVIVTGGASGLGGAVVRAIRESGGGVTAFDVRNDSGDGEIVRTDVADAEAMRASVERVVAERDGLTALVCCAGIDACGPLAGVPAEQWDRVIDVNLRGVANAVRASLPHLERSGGRMALIASTLGLRALPDATAYCASKFGVVGFTRALAAETAGRIGVSLIIPGGMATPFFDGRTEQYKPPADARLNRPEDVAGAILFALTQPPGCEIREMVICPSTESSWP